ncbi:gas vesicle protein [Mycobacterium sp.]|uniref:gas vesicle protein n=1 Tax=Mycobacterium sp. TaxID=1785 RepID=UPI003F7FDD57
MTFPDDDFSPVPRSYGGGVVSSSSGQSTNLGDILERVLDKGLVIAGDIKVNLLDIELLTIKLRLVIASLETAKEVGIDWWTHDPWLSGNKSELQLENEQLRARIEKLEQRDGEGRALDERSAERGDVD